MDKPYRQPWLTNIPLDVYLVIALFISYYIILGPPFWLKNMFRIVDYEDDNWKYWVFLITVINFLLDFCLEKFLVAFFETCWSRRKAKKIMQKMKENPNYDFPISDYNTVKNYKREIEEEKKK